jgi:transcriptional regulator with XRE-family HTH domain
VSDEVEGIRGEYRKPTPAEIGLIVRLFREQRGIKRTSLAADANVSEKTLERVENGTAVRDGTYKRIAAALGLDGEAFVTAAYIPTIEEMTERAKREQEELRKTHNSVPVERLQEPRQLLRLFQTYALIVEDQNVDSKDLDAVAAFKDSLRDWSDIAADIPESQRLEAARGLLDEARAIEKSGYELRVGVTDRYSVAGSRMEMAVVAFLPLPSDMPSEVWLPKKMRMGW